MDHLELIIAAVYWIATFLLLFVFPSIFVFRSGRFWTGALIVWLILIAFAAMGFALNRSRTMFLWAMLCTGWLNGIVVCLPGLIILRLKRRSASRTNPEKE